MTMEKKLRYRFRPDEDGVVLRILFFHPMETGKRRNGRTGELVPAFYIDTVEIYIRNELVLTVKLGPYVSKNPYFRVNFLDANEGDPVKFVWRDNLGEAHTDNTFITFHKKMKR